MRIPKTLSTLRIAMSYLLLAVLAVLVSVFIYGELQDYLASDTIIQHDTKLLMAHSLLTQLHEAKSLSKLAIQSKKQESCNTYLLKIDWIHCSVDSMKRRS